VCCEWGYGLGAVWGVLIVCLCVVSVFGENGVGFVWGVVMVGLGGRV